MSGLLHYLELQAKVRLGLSGPVVTWAVVSGISASIGLVFFLFALTIALADRYGALMATLMLGALFVVVAAIALIAVLNAHRRTLIQAKQALAIRGNAPWFNPSNLAVGVQIGRAIGWRRLIPLAAVGVLAAGLAREWYGNHSAHEPDDRDGRA